MPGIETTINLGYSKDTFRIISPETNWPQLAEVVLEVSDAHFVVPLGELNAKLWHHIDARLNGSSGHPAEKALFYYLQTHVNVITIPPGTNFFKTSIYPSAAALPCR